jgi:hypothetical protein
VTTGGDGSRAGLWLDDDGRQHIVHLGSGSGSTMMCRLTHSPVEFLRLAAIGYDELCWPEAYALTSEEAHDEDDEDEEFAPPLAFRAWVETTFGVVAPDRASEIVTDVSGMDDKSSNDPFWRWMREQPDRRRR